MLNILPSKYSMHMIEHSFIHSKARLHETEKKNKNKNTDR